MNFEEYLTSKKIDAKALMAADAEMYKEWQALFDAVSPASFTAQKLFLINPVRRKFPLKTEVTSSAADANVAAAKPSSKPVFKPKLK